MGRERWGALAFGFWILDFRGFVVLILGDCVLNFGLSFFAFIFPPPQDTLPYIANTDSKYCKEIYSHHDGTFL